MFRSPVTVFSLLIVRVVLGVAASTTSTATSSTRQWWGSEWDPEWKDPDIPITAGVQEELDAAIALWESHGMTKYTMGFQRLCFCWGLQPILVTVIEDDVTTNVIGRATLEPLGDEYAYTVERLFGKIQSALDESAYEIRVEYDDVYGYVLDLFIDYIKNMIDEEETVRVDFLEPTSVLVEEVLARIEQWTALRVQNYSYTFQQFCSAEQECGDEMIQPMRVRVLNGAVFSIDGAFLAISRRVDGTIPAGLGTVSALLTYILLSSVDDNGSGAFSVEVEYDAVYGFPSNVKIDFDENDPSDRVEVSLSGFTELTDQEAQALLGQVVHIPETSPPKETIPLQEENGPETSPPKETEPPQEENGPETSPPKETEPPQEQNGPETSPPKETEPPQEQTGPETSPPKETEPPQEQNGQDASLATHEPKEGEGIAPVSGGTPSDNNPAKESTAAVVPVLSKRALGMGLVLLFGGASTLY